MIRFCLVACILLFSGASAFSQYYYQDIISAGRSASQYTLLKKLNLKKVVASSFDPDGVATENFSLAQELNSANNCLTTLSKSDYTGESVLRTYYNTAGQIILSVDSSSSLLTRTTYSYSADGKLQVLEVSSNDTVQQYTIAEKHVYSYNAAGNPSRLLRIKNNTDTTYVEFIPSENGKPGVEHWYRNNRKTDTWYYYYDAKGQLTDVARFNARANQILPDLIFEYDDAGRLSQLTTVQAGSNQYRIWKYIYDTRGLKVKEGVFNKYRQPEGRIEYSYQ